MLYIHENKKSSIFYIINLLLIMIRKLLSHRFATTTADYLSTKGLKMFGSGDYPESLNFSRPFRNFQLI